MSTIPYIYVYPYPKRPLVASAEEYLLPKVLPSEEIPEETPMD